MPASAPAQLLRVVLKLTVIGFAALFMGFLLTPAGARRRDSGQTHLSEVLAARSDAGLDDSPVATPTPSGRSPMALIALDVHIGPGVNYQVVGSLPRGAKLDVIGRDASSQWIAIAFAGGTKINGWVPSQSVSGVSDIKSLPLAPVTLLP